MRSPGSLRVAAAAALLAVACGPVNQPAHRTASGVQVAPASEARRQSSCPAGQPAPRFSPSPPSNRNLEIVWLKGSQTYVIRDITDILHPTTVSTFGVRPQFVNANEVSFLDGDTLVRMRLAGSSRTVVAGCVSLFAWSPNGTTVAYVGSNQELHQVSGGQNRVFDSIPVWPGGYGCESRTCADSWDFRLLYSPSGGFISLNQLPPGLFRIWTSGGTLLKAMYFTDPVPGSNRTMTVWSGDRFYFRDDAGVHVWRDGTESLVLPGVSWIRPYASPGGGQIVYETRDAGNSTAHVYLLDTTSGTVRELAKSRSEPAFLNAHLIWYREERPCTPSDKCTDGPTIWSGKTYIYDLLDNTETESLIAAVWDVWPHPA